MKKIVKAWSFPSGSSELYYQTLLYSDGTTSCDCKGWTRRCKNGQRSCKHTRSVDMDMADQTCEKRVSYERKPREERSSRYYDFGGNVSRAIPI